MWNIKLLLQIQYKNANLFDYIPILAALYMLSMSNAPLRPYNNVFDMVGTNVEDVTSIFTQLFL